MIQLLIALVMIGIIVPLFIHVFKAMQPCKHPSSS